MSHYKIDERFVNEILSYLSSNGTGTTPFNQVSSIINRLSNIEKIEDKKDVPKE